MDETSDISKTEQVCLSYVHEGIKKGVKKSFLLDFLKANIAMQTESLFNQAKDATISLNLDLNNTVAQCFDGASNMWYTWWLIDINERNIPIINLCTMLCS